MTIENYDISEETKKAKEMSNKAQEEAVLINDLVGNDKYVKDFDTAIKLAEEQLVVEKTEKKSPNEEIKKESLKNEEKVEYSQFEDGKKKWEREWIRDRNVEVENEKIQSRGVFSFIKKLVNIFKNKL